ncbi:MAG: M48 family metalloprotease [Cyanobacteria bacterium J06635_1]
MTADSSQRPQLNPFVFPSETDFRFVLLVLMTVGSSLICFERLIWLRLANQAQLPQLEQCFGEATGRDLLSLLNNLSTTGDCIGESVGQITDVYLQGQLTGLGLMLLFVVVAYSLLPTLMVTRERLVPLERQPQSQPLCEAYGDLCKTIGIVRPPQLMLKATDRGIGPRIFGCWGRYQIVVPGGLALRFQEDPATFRAVMLHELGHLKNRDVDKTYLAFAIGLAFLGVSFLPVMGVSLWALVTNNEVAVFWETGWRGGMLLLVVYLTLASVVRSREYYADLQARHWEPGNDRLAHLLGETLAPPVKSWQSKLLRLTRHVPLLHRHNWDYALQFHPDPSYRAQVLTNTDDLFHFDFWVALGTGLSVTLVSQPILSSLETLRIFSPFSNPEYGFVAVGFIFGPAIAGICALGLWRMAFAQLLHADFTQRVGIVGLGVALGIVVGRYLALDAPATLPGIENFTVFAKLIGFNILWASFLALSLVCFAHWIHQCSRLWLLVTFKKVALRWVYRLGMIVSSIVLSLGLGWFLMIRDMGELISVYMTDGLVLIIAALVLYIGYLAQHWLTLIISTLLWAFPLSACLWQRRATAQSIPGWIFLDQPVDSPTLPKMAHGKPLFHSLKRGMLGGIAYVAMLLLLRILLRRLVPEVTRESDGFALFFYYGVNLGIAVLVQWIVALFTPRHPSYTNGFAAIHGLFSVAVSGLIMAVGILWLNVAFGGRLNTQFVKDTLMYTLNLGTMVALPTLLLRVGIGGRE